MTEKIFDMNLKNPSHIPLEIYYKIVLNVIFSLQNGKKSGKAALFALPRPFEVCFSESWVFYSLPVQQYVHRLQGDRPVARMMSSSLWYFSEVNFSSSQIIPIMRAYSGESGSA